MSPLRSPGACCAPAGSMPRRLCSNRYRELPDRAASARRVAPQTQPFARRDRHEELRVAPVSAYAGNADLVDGRGRPVEATIWLDEFIGGREVRQGFVLIGFNTRTHEVTLLRANFLPDRELTYTPRLTETQARAKAPAQLRKFTEPLALVEHPRRARLRVRTVGRVRRGRRRPRLGLQCQARGLGCPV